MHLGLYTLGGLYMISSLFRFSNFLAERIGRRERFYPYIYSSLHSIGITALASLSYQQDLFAVHRLESYRVNEGMKLTMGVAFSYFLLDLFQCRDMMYIVHHLCALQLIGSCMIGYEERPYMASYLMAMIALFEWNTPLFNLGFLCRDLRLHYSLLGTVWSTNLILYSLSRLVMIPMLAYYYWLHEATHNYAMYVSLSVIYGGSLYWAVRQTKGIWRHVVKRIPPPVQAPAPTTDSSSPEDAESSDKNQREYTYPSSPLESSEEDSPCNNWPSHTPEDK